MPAGKSAKSAAKKGPQPANKEKKGSQSNAVPETEPFLPLATSTEPVRLTPSWEDGNLTSDELNFRNLTLDQVDLEMNPPKDRLNLVFLTLILHGVGTLMPWNMFINAKRYFVDYKLSEEYTGISSEYSTNFLSYLGFAAQIPNVIFNWLNIFVQLGGNLTTRIVWSIFVEVIIFIFTIILAMVNSAEWPGVFFWITMVTVVALNMANGIYQNTVYGMAAKLPFKYTGAVVLGSNISGTFTAIIDIISIAVAPNVRTAAIYYFITAMFILLACFDTYFALPLNRFFRFHEYISLKEQLAKQKANMGTVPSTPYFSVFRKCFPQCFNVFMVFFVTLAVFPTVYSDVKMEDEEFFIPEKYFTAVTCFLTFNFFAMIGNMLPALFTWPGPRFLCIPVLFRLLFIPFFIFCNYHPYGVDRVFPVIIRNDWIYWIGGVFLGLTSGYYSSLAMMYCPRMVEPEYAATAGMFAAASLVTGIFAGINFSIVFPLFVRKVHWDIDV